MSEKSIPILRSVYEYDGIEFTYSFWIYVKVKTINTDNKIMHVFINVEDLNKEDNIYQPNNAPGKYLYPGWRTENQKDDLINDFTTLRYLKRLNIFHDKKNANNPFKYYDDIYVDNNTN